jgi:hypothetical protein
MGTANAAGRLPSILRQGRDLLQPLRQSDAAGARALDRLERDLLPRTADGAPYVVAGIVGPNNAGKSALFNALIGTPLSPSVPTGGATRRLVGAAHPDLLARLAQEPTLARFRLRPVSDATQVAEQALITTADPAELLAVPLSTLPPTLMLIDTPDFDSILHDNRLASESLLAVADLVVAIVTRHTYQNRDVVEFLDTWLDHGRPWILVYNEATDADVARAHGTKLAHDVGTMPLALFWAPHDVAIQQGRAALAPRVLPLDAPSVGAPHASPITRPEFAVAPNASLRDALFHLEAITEIKTRAFAASLTSLRRDVEAVSATLMEEVRDARDILSAAAAHARRTGLDVAAGAMPAGPFIEAFRVVLDRRTNPISRSWRTLLRHVRVGIERLPRLLFQGPARSDDPRPQLAAVEQQQLRHHWPGYWEALVADLGIGGRHSAREHCRSEIRTWLDADLRAERSAHALEQSARNVAETVADFDRFQTLCEGLIEAAMETRGFETDIQVAADLTTLAPLALAAAVIVKTGGLGTDLAAASGGALSSFLMEKYMHLLGSSLTTEARERWTDLRGRQLGDVLVASALAQSAPALRDIAARNEKLIGELRAWAAGLVA